MTSIATTAGVRDEQVIVPRSPAATAARLSFDNGVERMRLVADPALDDLVRARFAQPLPDVWADDHNVHLEYPLGSRLLHGTGRSTIWLNSSQSWSLDVHGGAAHVDADLAGLRLRAMSFHSGVARTRIRLGRPVGECAIRLTAVKNLRVERPDGVPVRVELLSRTSKISMDRGLADGYDDAPDRFLVIVSAGADGLAIL